MGLNIWLDTMNTWVNNIHGALVFLDDEQVDELHVGWFNIDKIQILVSPGCHNLTILNSVRSWHGCGNPWTFTVDFENNATLTEKNLKERIPCNFFFLMAYKTGQKKKKKNSSLNIVAHRKKLFF